MPGPAPTSLALVGRMRKHWGAEPVRPGGTEAAGDRRREKGRMVQTKVLRIAGEGGFRVSNITDHVREFVTDCGLVNGQVLVFYRHTTGAVIIAEHEAGILADLQDALDKIAPASQRYLHHLKQVDFNGHAHVRSAIMGLSVVIPVLEGKLMMGTYQEVLVIDEQVETASREVVLQAIGE